MNLYERIMRLIQPETYEMIELFGDTGTGKSTFFWQICLAAHAKEKTVKIIDMEGNFRSPELTGPAKYHYVYYEEFDEFYKYMIIDREFVKEKWDVVLLDSVGLPVLGKYARGRMKEKGDILLKCQAVADELRMYAKRENALVLITNQPQSTFSGIPSDKTRPFGEKHQFFVKEIWRAWIFTQDSETTSIQIKAWRSRFCGKGTLLFSMDIDDEGVDIIQDYKRGRKRKAAKKRRKPAKKRRKVAT